MQTETRAEWFPTAVGSDILNAMVVPAMLPSGPIAVWRTQSGKLSANGDRCPHRGMRLSHGFVRGETLSCIYHGWRYGRDGACQHIPAHPSVVPPSSINCGPLTATEKNGVVWVATAHPGYEPQDYEGFEALRSIEIAAPMQRLLSAGKASVTAEGSVQLVLGGVPAHLLVYERASSVVFVIALIETRANVDERIRASTALEALRHKAEAGETQKVVA